MSSADENGETNEERATRHNTEAEVITCAVPGSLGANIRKLLNQGLCVDPDAPAADNARCMAASPDHAIARVASIQLRAIAIALTEGVSGENQLSESIELSNEDAAYALASIATTLEVGLYLADDLRLAQHKAGAS